MYAFAGIAGLLFFIFMEFINVISMSDVAAGTD